MIKQASILAAVVAVASALPVAGAQATHCGTCTRRVTATTSSSSAGYARRGTATGLHFGFVTYAGDPFAHDDYYDGHRCFYRHHHDYCLVFRPPLDPFSDVR